jgi:hypothetical protein
MRVNDSIHQAQDRIRAQVRLGMQLLGADEVGKLERIANVEYRLVVAYEIPVSSSV